MGSVTSGIGLASGLDIASIVDQLMQVEARPRTIVQNQISVLEAQKAAFLSINSRLLALEGTTTTLKGTDAFRARSVSVSNPDAMSVTADTGAPLGNYSLSVGRLATNQQVISSGFTSKTETLGAGTLTFDSARSRLQRDTSLSSLHGGEGITRGKIQIRDRSGSTATIDLTRVASMNDVLDAINSASEVNVTARVNRDGLQLVDNTGQAVSDLVVTEIGGGATASSLGILGNSGGTDVITGNQINYVSRDTYLGEINDGLGVGTTSVGQDDLLITKHDGSTVNVDLGGAETIGDVIDAINAVGGTLQASLGGDGLSLELTDTDAYAGTQLAVASAAGSTAAVDLGFVVADVNQDGVLEGDRLVSTINSVMLKNLNGGTALNYVGDVEMTGATLIDDLFNGTGLPATSGDGTFDIRLSPKDTTTLVTLDLDGLTTVQDLIDAFDTATGGDITLSIEDNIRFVATDNTGGGASFRILDRTGLGYTSMADLGIAIDDPVLTQVTGVDTDPLPSAGVSLGSFYITNRAGVTTTVDVGSARSVDDVLEAINDAGAGVVASLNSAGNGIELTDQTGSTLSNLIVTDRSGTLATDLGLARDVASDSIGTGDLDLKYLSENTKLDALNNGSGITAGKFTIFDSTGASSEIDLTQDEATLGEVIAEINSRPSINVTASINSTGDGILLTDNAGGTLAMRVEEKGSTTAKDLGILGADTDLLGYIDGSFEREIEVEATDTLEDVVQKIIDADLGISASLINDGSGVNPYRLSLASDNTGSDGAFVFDDGGLGFDAFTLSEAQDATAFFGANDPSTAVLITSSDNTLEDTFGGLTVDLLSTTDEPVTISVERNNADAVSAVTTFVTAFNGLMDTLDQHDSYDAETEQRGLLLGNGTVQTIRSRLFSMATSQITGVGGSYSRLFEVGITIGDGARLEVDESKLNQALNEDPDAVESLFTANGIVEVDNTDDLNLPPGVSVPATTELEVYGFAQRIAEMLEQFTDSIDGTVTLATNNLDSRIEVANNRVDQLNILLASKRERIENQFFAMEQVIAQLQAQSSSLQSLAALASSTRQQQG